MMESYNYAMEEKKPIFTTSSDTNVTTTTPSFTPPEKRNMSNQADSVFSPLSAQFQNLMNQEPRAADTAPSAADVDLMNYRMAGSDLLFDDVDSTTNNFFGMADSRAESVTSSAHNMWNENPGAGGSQRAGGGGGGDMIDTFDFLIKSVASANNYVSMLTREQLSVLRAIRPSLLYEFLLEVAKVLGDKRMRRALPHVRVRLLQEQRRERGVLLEARAEGLARARAVPRAARVPLPALRRHRRPRAHHQVLPRERRRSLRAAGAGQPAARGDPAGTPAAYRTPLASLHPLLALVHLRDQLDRRPEISHPHASACHLLERYRATCEES